MQIISVPFQPRKVREASPTLAGLVTRRKHDPDLVQARNEEDQELQRLQQQLATMPKKK